MAHEHVLGGPAARSIGLIEYVFRVEVIGGLLINTSCSCHCVTGQIELKYVTGIDRIAVPDKNRFTIYADTIKLYEFRANSEKECDKWVRWLMNVFSEDRPLDRREW